jgi:hypothetical protein
MPLIALRRVKRRWLPLILILIFTFCIFWLGRLSAQIGMLERGEELYYSLSQGF